MPTRRTIERTCGLSRQTGVMLLAGGRGSRLAPLTDRRSKPGVPFGGHLRIIDFTLSNCMNSGLRTVGVLTQYLSTELLEHCHMTWGWTNRVFGDIVMALPSHQGPSGEGWYQGTADAIYQQIPTLLGRNLYKYIMVLSADHIYKMDYAIMLDDHIHSGADISLGVFNVPLANASRFGVLEMNVDGRITRFLEKPDQPPADPNKPGYALASMGIYIFERELLIDLLTADHHDPDSGHDFGFDIIPKACETLHVQGHRFEDSESQVQKYWRDVGTIDSYFDANMDLLSPDPELDLYDTRWPIWSYMEPAPGPKFTGQDEQHGSGAAYHSIVSAGCIVAGKVTHSILFNYCYVGRNSSVDNSLLLPGVEVGKGCKVHNAIIEEELIIPDGLHIGIDPEKDRERFHVTEQGRVVVTGEMLEKLEAFG